VEKESDNPAVQEDGEEGEGEGEAEVDQYLKDRDKYQLCPDNGNVFNGKYLSCTMYNTDKGSSKFYVIQLIKHKTNHKYSIFTRWGRIGNPGQNKLEPVTSATGPETFVRKYNEKLKHKYK